MQETLTKRQLTVGIGAIIHDDCILFVKRQAPNIPEYDEKWELPGGKIEAGEAVEEAIEREVLEETGVDVTCLELLPFSYTRDIHTDAQDFHIIVLCAKCTISPIDPNAKEKNTSKNKSLLTSKWIPIKDIPFNQIIPGSKEFILWCLHSVYPAIIPANAPLYEMDLQLVDKVNNKFRQYKVILSFHPGETMPYKVSRHWGRIGRTLTCKSERFRRMDQALEFAQQLVADRERHGYELTFIDGNHPLRSWLRTTNLPVGTELSRDTPAHPSLFDEEVDTCQPQPNPSSSLS